MKILYSLFYVKNGINFDRYYLILDGLWISIAIKPTEEENFIEFQNELSDYERSGLKFFHECKTDELLKNRKEIIEVLFKKA